MLSLCCYTTSFFPDYSYSHSVDIAPLSLVLVFHRRMLCIGYMDMKLIECHLIFCAKPLNHSSKVVNRSVGIRWYIQWMWYIKKCWYDNTGKLTSGDVRPCWSFCSSGLQVAFWLLLGCSFETSIQLWLQTLHLHTLHLLKTHFMA